MSMQQRLILEELIFLCQFNKANQEQTLEDALKSIINSNDIKSPAYGINAEYIYKNNINTLKTLEIDLDFNWYKEYVSICKNIGYFDNGEDRIKYMLIYGLPDYAKFLRNHHASSNNNHTSRNVTDVLNGGASNCVFFKGVVPKEYRRQLLRQLQSTTTTTQENKP